MTVEVAPIIRAMEANDPRAGARLALMGQPALLFEALDYPRITDNAEPYLEFIRAWPAVAHPLDQPLIDRWLVDASVSDMAYLEAEAEAARLLASSVRAAKDHLAELLADVDCLTRSPEAGLTRAQAAAYKDTVDRLRAVPIPRPPQARPQPPSARNPVDRIDPPGSFHHSYFLFSCIPTSTGS